ncbi:MAG TPA: hypothetical protein VL966_05340 [Alphaproteobacteria bacterium]|jgi:hypothetical protein|nr:hypothetical protein [Alphaproteobacteria bacterium]
MRIPIIVPFFAVAFAASCSTPQPGSGQGAGASADSVSGSTGPITSTELLDVGPIPVIVFGAAFGLDRGVIEQAVAGEMQASTSGNARFVTSSQANIDPQGYSVVMLFNAPEGADPAAYCSGNPPIPMSGPAQRYSGWSDVQLAGALCRNGQEVQQVRASAGDVSSLDDPAFRRMVGQAASKLTPTTAEPVSGSSGTAR